MPQGMYAPQGPPPMGGPPMGPPMGPPPMGGPPMGGPPMGPPMGAPMGGAPGDFVGQPEPGLGDEPVLEGENAGLVSELTQMLAAWPQKDPNTQAGQYFQDVVAVLSKYL